MMRSTVDARWQASSVLLSGPGCPIQEACDNPATHGMYQPGPGAQNFNMSLQINILRSDAGGCPFNASQDARG